MSGWDFNTGGGNKAEFTKFTPGGLTKIRVIDAEPYVRWVHWMPQFKRSINCPGKGCPICEIRKQQKANKEPYTHAMARRFAINILNRDTGRVEIMEQGIGFFEDIRDLMLDLKNEGKSLIDVDLKVRRRGSTKDDTSYRVDVDTEYPLSDEDKEMASKKINFAEYFALNKPEDILRILNGETWDEVFKSAESTTEEAEEEIELK